MCWMNKRRYSYVKEPNSGAGYCPRCYRLMGPASHFCSIPATKHPLPAEGIYESGCGQFSDFRADRVSLGALSGSVEQPNCCRSKSQPRSRLFRDATNSRTSLVIRFDMGILLCLAPSGPAASLHAGGRDRQDCESVPRRRALLARTRR